MIRVIAFSVLFALVGMAHAQSDSSSELPRIDQADPAISAQLEGTRSLAFQLPGFSRHFESPRNPDGSRVQGRDFNEKHWGFGIEIERPLAENWAGWVSKTTVGVMKDSLDAMGAYAGYTRQKRFVDTGTFSVDAGAGAFLFYRTLQFDGPHRLLPAILPVLSVRHQPTGLGANVLAIPGFRTSQGHMPSVVYIQFTKTF